MTEHYLDRQQFAARIGVKPDTLGRYKLPPPDVMIGSQRGWLPETIDAWQAARPHPRNTKKRDTTHIKDDAPLDDT